MYKKKQSNKELSDQTKIKHAIDFFEELSWLIDSKKNIQFKEIPDLLRKRLSVTDKQAVSVADKYISPNPNIHYLIGVLPRFFLDTELFTRNEDIGDFAREVLNIDVARVEKRSKYELIGLIVCETNNLDDKKLSDLVDSLSQITKDDQKMKQIATAKNLSDFSWNETIRELGQ